MTILHTLAKATGAKAPKRRPVMRDPRHLEREYHMKIRRGPVNDAHAQLAQRLDDGEPPAEAVDAARAAHKSRWTEALIAGGIIGGTFAAVSRYQALQLNGVIATFLGVATPLVGNEITLSTDLAEAVRRNVELIGSLNETYYDAVSSSILSMAADGTLTPEKLAKVLQDSYGITDRRAAIIAQDQVQKFFGTLNQQRQQALGIDSYYWSTMLDDRVRHGHAAREGTLWSWDDVPPDVGGGEGPPGIPISCRCVAIPNFAEVVGS